ncbi:fatty acid synthase-like [Vespula maculifrons]|uniref:Fatty acid synthase-like n=1 Tax=Vespula maculifrons TaxID=7453 RepID=A0ABD2ANK2_VESMC
MIEISIFDEDFKYISDHLEIMNSGEFEMVERSAIVTRMIRVVKNLWEEKIFFDMINEKEELNTEDIYKELKLRGYQYNGLFRSMHNISVLGSKGHIKWKKNWVLFMNNLL